MAFRNSVKAACLSFDNEQPSARVDEAGEPVASWRTWEEETRALVAALPGKIHLDLSAMPAPEALAPAASEAPQTEDEAFLASSWHARAEALRAMAATLPSKTSGALMPKIAKLYDQFAREAGWGEPETLATPEPLAPPNALPPDDLASAPALEEPCIEEKPPALVAEPEPDEFAPAEEPRDVGLPKPEPAPEELGREEELQAEPEPNEVDVGEQARTLAPQMPEPVEFEIEEDSQSVAPPEFDELCLEDKPQALPAEPERDDFDIEEEPRAKQLELKLVAPPADPRRAKRSIFSPDDLDEEEEPQTLAPSIVLCAAPRVAFPRRPLPRRR